MDFDDLFPQPAAAGVRAGGKFQPKAKPRPKKVAPTSVLTVDNGKGDPKDSLPSEILAFRNNIENQANVGLLSEKADTSWLDLETDFLPSDASHTRASDELEPTLKADSAGFSATVAPVGLEECLGVDGENCGNFESNSQKVGRENVDIFSGLDSLDIFLAQTSGGEAFTGENQNVDERVTHDVEACPDPSVTEDSAIHRNSTVSEIDEDGHNEAETLQIETGSSKHGNDVPNVQFVPSEDEQVQGESPSNSGLDYTEGPPEPPESLNSYNVFDDENRERESQNKEDQGKPKNLVAEKVNPVRKRKNVNDVPDQSTKAPQKKFKHSTRRKRRSLDKELLETPDEEIRFLAIKDMLRLVDYKEWLEKKEAKTSGTSSTDKSTRSSLHVEESQNEEHAFDSERNEGQESIHIQSSTFLLNYQSYMKKEPRSRWSKQDTQLFYEGIQQFGSDLSMIQQLFPEKSRHQIKLKYKKEERQHPLKLSEALANRARDHSHFEIVIEKLKKAAAAKAAEQESNVEEPDGMAGADADVTIIANNEEGVKSDPGENVAGKGEEAGGGRAEVLKDSEDEGDDEIWSSYQSEF